jgi:protein involved in sex pheromone biosynthesis
MAIGTKDELANVKVCVSIFKFSSADSLHGLFHTQRKVDGHHQLNRIADLRTEAFFFAFVVHFKM